MKIFIFLLSFLISFTAAASWIEGNTFGVPDDNGKWPIAVKINSNTGEGVSWDDNQYPLTTTYNEGGWATVDLSSEIPADTKAVFLSGLLIITHGTQAETCDLYVNFRAPGDSLPGANKQGQVIETEPGNGQRSTMAVMVPVKNQKFEFYWYKSTSGGYPSHCAYGVNLSLQGYVR